MSKKTINPVVYGIIAILLVIILIVGLSWKRGTNTVPETTSPVVNTNTPAVVTNSSTTNQPTGEESAYGVRILTNQVTQTVQGDIISYRFDGNTSKHWLNIMPQSYQAMVLNESSIKQRTPVTVGGTTGERLTVTSAKDGSAEEVVQVVKNGYLYDFRGDSTFLDQLDQYIAFTN